MRSIRQPGPPNEARIVSVPVGAVSADEALRPGGRLLDRLWDIVERLGGEGGCFQLRGGALAPFAYVMPALSTDDDHAAFYSEVFRPEGESVLQGGAVTLGFKDGARFFHCHALWREASGRRNAGHVLPDETMIARPVLVSGLVFTGARFEARPDRETGFPLFSPVPTGTVPLPDARPALALRLAPNQDLIETLERATAAAGYGAAVVHGGVASIIEARFEDGPPIEGFATEMFVTGSHISGSSALAGRSRLEVGIVDYRGAIATGSLLRGDNPVLMTFEGVLAPLPAGPEPRP